MATKVTQKKNDKPVLIKCGKHLINPNDVSCISQIRVKETVDDEDWQDDELPILRRDGNKVLYVVRFISNPNPTYTCWVEKKDIGILLEQFNIIQ